MPFIGWVEDEDATGEVAELYGIWRKANPKRDRISDILKCFSARPDVLREIMSFSYSLHFRDGHLPWKTKELLATYVSALNRCPYCTTSHAYFLEINDPRTEVVEALSHADLKAAPVTPAERALLEFAELLTVRSYQNTADDVEKLRTAGWNEQQIAEAVYVIAMFGLFNRVANAFGLGPVNYREILDRSQFSGQFKNPLEQE